MRFSLQCNRNKNNTIHTHRADRTMELCWQFYFERIGFCWCTHNKFSFESAWKRRTRNKTKHGTENNNLDLNFLGCTHQTNDMHFREKYEKLKTKASENKNTLQHNTMTTTEGKEEQSRKKKFVIGEAVYEMIEMHWTIRVHGRSAQTNALCSDVCRVC